MIRHKTIASACVGIGLSTPEMRAELEREDAITAERRREYIQDLRRRAEICVATGELPYPMTYLPLHLRMVALMLADRAIN